MVAERRGLEKWWDLTERVLPADGPSRAAPRPRDRPAARRPTPCGRSASPPPSRSGTTSRSAGTRSSRASSTASSGGARSSGSPSGGLPGAWYVHRDDLPALERIERGSWRPRSTLLSPFDNLIHDRERTALLFGLDYRMEIYVPKAKRRYGYYAMPLLHGDRFVARVDPAVDRAAGRLVLNAVHAEDGVRPSARSRAGSSPPRDDLAAWAGSRGRPRGAGARRVAPRARLKRAGGPLRWRFDSRREPWFLRANAESNDRRRGKRFGAMNRVELQLRRVVTVARRRRRRRWNATTAITPGSSPSRSPLLISPLRYDVHVRRAFFELLERHSDLFTADRDAFDLLLERHPYFTWFRYVNCALHHRPWLESPQRFREALSRRVDRNRALFESVMEHGIRADSPIEVSTGDLVRPTSTGKRIDRSLFMSDGSHRLALLMLRGQSCLLPGQYVIDHRREIRPVDNTGVLLRRFDVPDSEYFAFVSSGYLDSPVCDRGAFLERVGELGASVVEEARGVCAPMAGTSGASGHVGRRIVWGMRRPSTRSSFDDRLRSRSGTRRSATSGVHPGGTVR